VLLLQEPLIINNKIFAFEGNRQIHKGDLSGAAIVILNEDLRIIEMTQFNSEYIIAAKVSGQNDRHAITVVSAYFKYNMPTSCFVQKLHVILDSEKHVMIGADVNAHSKLWHCPSRNDRGRQVEEMIEDHDLRVVNSPSPLRTYDRDGMGSSDIDVTLITPAITGRVSGWSVVDNTDSDHNALIYNLKLNSLPPAKTDRKFNTARADWEKFKNELATRKTQINETTIDTMADSIITVVQHAAEASMPTTRKTRRTKKQPWWNDTLTIYKKDLDRYKRNRLNITDKPAYNRKRNAYLKEIRSAKMTAWRSFSNDINVNIWGKAFRWAKKGPSHRTIPSTMQDVNGDMTKNWDDTADLLLSTFFPTEENKVPIARIGPLLPYDKEVDNDRVRAAIWRMSPSKAPGPDGITAKILRKAWPVIGQDITKLFTRCLSEATFPSHWKVAKLVVIPKPGKKDLASPKSYRPISLLPTMAKALETLIIQDLIAETNLDDFQQQHGFVTNRSTITAIKALYNWTGANRHRYVFGAFLDITGAFDNVGWSPVLSRLEQLGASLRTLKMIHSYLENRQVRLNLEGKLYEKTLERGCPQGSQLGPTLWKVAMTAVGQIPLEETANIIIYADDIVVLVGAARPPTAHRRLEAYFDGLIEWAKTYGLSFSPTKSQLLTIKGGLKPNYAVTFGTGQNAPIIRASETVRYLGVTLDSRQSFWSHVESLKNKNKDMYKRLRHMTSANWGMSRISAMTIYRAVFLPRITYAAEIWEKACHMKKAIQALGSTQRDPLLAITSSYKTASTNCLTAVAGVLPLDLEVRRVSLARKLKAKEIKIEEHDDEVSELMEIWQTRYDATDKGEWTKYMIPNLTQRCALPLVMDHYTTQFLTGHGDFKSKLFSFKLVQSPNCECGNGAETVRHVLLTCRRNEAHRDRLRRTIIEEGEAWPPRSGAFLSTRRAYEALRTFSEKSLKNREDR